MMVTLVSRALSVFPVVIITLISLTLRFLLCDCDVSIPRTLSFPCYVIVALISRALLVFCHVIVTLVSRTL